MNETLSTIHMRYSCRGYAAKMPPQDVLNAIMQAANTSPSAMNKQSWRIILIQDPQLMREMEEEALLNLAGWQDERGVARSETIFYGAPCMAVIPIDRQSTAYAEMDCGIVCQTIALAAASLGLGSVICGMTVFTFKGGKEEYFRKRLQFPEGYTFGMSVLLGLPESTKPPHTSNPDNLIYIR